MRAIQSVILQKKTKRTPVKVRASGKEEGERLRTHAGHEAVGIRFPKSDLERAKVDLSQSSSWDFATHGLAVELGTVR